MPECQTLFTRHYSVGSQLQLQNEASALGTEEAHPKMMIGDDYPLDFGVPSQTNPYRLLDSPASPGLQFVSANSCHVPLAAAKI